MFIKTVRSTYAKYKPCETWFMKIYIKD